MQQRWAINRHFIAPVLVGLLLVGLFLTSLYSYLLFHSLAELFGIAIAGGIFTLAWNSRRFQTDNYLLIVGVGLLFAAILALMHTLTYEGMAVFPALDANPATQLWVATRYVTALTFVAAPLLLSRRVSLGWLLAIYTLVTAWLLASILAWHNFPVCYVPDVGLTPFKKDSEYVISLLFVVSAGLLYRRRGRFDAGVFRLLLGSIGASVVCELAFTLYADVFDLANVVGHLFAILSYIFIYRAIIETGLVRPYSLLFRDLTQAEQRYRDLFDEAPIQYVTTRTVKGAPVIEDCNDLFVQTLGFTRDEVIGCPLRNFYDAASQILLQNDGYEKALAGESPQQERTLVAKDGHTIETIMRASPETDADGRVVGIRAAYVNITERKRMERELRRTQAELETRVRARTAALAQHAERLEILRAIDRAILAAESTDDIAQAVVGHVRRVLDCSRVTVLLSNPGGETFTLLAVDAEKDTVHRAGTVVDARVVNALVQGEREGLADLAALAQRPELVDLARMLLPEGARFYQCIPLAVGNETLGELKLWAPNAGALTPACREFAAQVADSLSVAIQHMRLFEQVSQSRRQLQQLSHNLVEMQEQQARQIGQDLHDDAGQALTALKLGLGLVARDEACPPVLVARIDELKQMADELMERLHSLSVNLRPVSLDRLGLAAALQQYAETLRRQGGLEIEVVAMGLENQRLSAEIETALYRVVQEAITNVARHAQASKVGVIVERMPAKVVAIIEDDGIGFDADAALESGRLGLLGMRERVEMVGGHLYIESAPGGPTSVFAEIPC